MTPIYDPYDGAVPAEHYEFYIKLGARFRTARVARGLTLEQLADVINITPQRLEKYENAELVFPIFELLPLIKHMDYPAGLEPKIFK